MTDAPYADVATHLRDELRRAWLRLEYEIRLGWTKPVVDDVVGPADMGRLFAQARGQVATGDDAGAPKVRDQWLAIHHAVDARIRASLAQPPGAGSPLVELLREFELTPRQWATLMYALLPEVDPNLVAAYRYLARDATCRGLDGRLLAQLVYDSPASRAIMAHDLSPSSPLLRFRLIDVATPGGASDSLMFRKLRAASRLVYLAAGAADELDPELSEFAELRRGKIAGSFPPIAMERATAAIRSGEVVLAIQGQRGVGKRLLLQLAAAHWNKRLLLLDGRRLAQLHANVLQPTIRALVRELRLLGAVPAFADVDDVVITEGDRDALPASFDALLAEWDGPVAITINRERMPRIHQRPIVHVDLIVPPLDVRTEMWQRIVPTLRPGEASSLSGKFAIPGGVIVSAAAAAIARRMPDAGGVKISATDLESAVAAQLHQRLSRLGKRLPTPFDIDDLIVDDDTRAALYEIAAAARQRRHIRQAFKLRGAAGISVLFSGHPGVGKTMSGTVLAKRLGLDIYEIDLAGRVDETARQQVHVRIANNTAVNFTLKIGQESTTVRVDASAVADRCSRRPRSKACLPPARSKVCRSTGATSLTLRNSSLACRSRTSATTSTRPKSVISQSPWVHAPPLLPASRWTASTSRTRPSAPTTSNISSTAIQRSFQITQSTMDPSNGLSSSSGERVH